MNMMAFVFLVSSLCAAPSSFLVQEDVIKEALKLPLLARSSVLKEKKGAFRTLKKLAFQDKTPLEIRWKALMSLSLLFPQKSQSLLKKASRDKRWFMRNAGLMGLTYSHSESARKEALRLLKDPSLIVRTAAVKVLKRHGQPLKDAPYLWEALYSPQNFRGGKSLWIRQHIVDVLAQWQIKKGLYDDVLAKALSDKDDAVRVETLKILKN